MRIDPKHIHKIIKTINVHDRDAKIFLFGSRVNDLLKGGDIDLLIVSNSINFTKKITILSELKKVLGDQKIDLLIKTPSEADNDPFIKDLFENKKIVAINT